jgi:two-component system OmpR family response regulator
VVDDDEGIRGLLRALFTRAGHEVDFAADGAEAVAAMATTSYNAVILDLMMPGVSGFEVLAQLERETPQRKCVIVVSAASEKIIQGLQSPAIHSKIRKPFELDELLARIEECMGEK